MNAVEQRAAIAIMLSMLVLPLTMPGEDDQAHEVNPFDDPTLYLQSTADEPIVLMEVRVAGASVLGAPRVMSRLDKLTLHVSGLGDPRQPWRVRWLHAGRMHHTSWPGGAAWLTIAGATATTPDPAPCVLGGGEELHITWDPEVTPRREATLEPNEFVTPVRPEPDWK